MIFMLQNLFRGRIFTQRFLSKGDDNQMCPSFIVHISFDRKATRVADLLLFKHTRTHAHTRFHRWWW